MLSTRQLVAIGVVLAIAASGTAFAQTTPDHHSMGSDQQQQMMQSGPYPMGPSQMQEMMRQHQGMMGAHAGMHATSTTPTIPGQDPFGAIQEIVQILDADPKTDWSKELDLAFWSSVKDSYWREELQAYLDQHPNGHFTVQRGHGRVVIDEDLSDLEVNQPPASGV
jgi:hypothetical protein